MMFGKTLARGVKGAAFALILAVWCAMAMGPGAQEVGSIDPTIQRANAMGPRAQGAGTVCLAPPGAPKGEAVWEYLESELEAERLVAETLDSGVLILRPAIEAGDSMPENLGPGHHRIATTPALPALRALGPERMALLAEGRTVDVTELRAELEPLLQVQPQWVEPTMTSPPTMLYHEEEVYDLTLPRDQLPPVALRTLKDQENWTPVLGLADLLQTSQQIAFRVDPTPRIECTTPAGSRLTVDLIHLPGPWAAVALGPTLPSGEVTTEWQDRVEQGLGPDYDGLTAWSAHMSERSDPLPDGLPLILEALAATGEEVVLADLDGLTLDDLLGALPGAIGGLTVERELAGHRIRSTGGPVPWSDAVEAVVRAGFLRARILEDGPTRLERDLEAANAPWVAAAEEAWWSTDPEIAAELSALLPDPARYPLWEDVDAPIAPFIEGHILPADQTPSDLVTLMRQVDDDYVSMWLSTYDATARLRVAWAVTVGLVDPAAEPNDLGYRDARLAWTVVY